VTGNHARDPFPDADADTAVLPGAGYLPAHDPAVHGPAYAIKTPGRDTLPFPAARPYTQPDAGEPCLCGYCDGGGNQPPPALPGGDPRAMLYAGPGIITRTWKARIREGAWDDIPAEFDVAHARTHLPAIKHNRDIHLDLSSGRHHLAAVFHAHPDVRTDSGVAEELHRMEAEMPGRMAELQDWVARRAAEWRRADMERQATAA